MSPEKQRIAIAEYCGWRNIRISGPWECTDPGEPREDLCGFAPMFDDDFRMTIPDYLNDLDSLHKAEIRMCRDDDGNQIAGRYISNLRICIGEGSFLWQCVFSTAPQRAEAFLRTIGKWEDSA